MKFSLACLLILIAGCSPYNNKYLGDKTLDEKLLLPPEVDHTPIPKSVKGVK